jgi:hypothetical protein
MAKRAGATITEVEGSHVIMLSQPQVVTDVILARGCRRQRNGRTATPVSWWLLEPYGETYAD